VPYYSKIIDAAGKEKWKTIKDLKIRALKTKDNKNKDIKKFLTNHFKGQAGSAVFRSSFLLPNSQINLSWLLQIPLAPEFKRYTYEYNYQIVKEVFLYKKNKCNISH